MGSCCHEKVSTTTLVKSRTAEVLAEAQSIKGKHMDARMQSGTAMVVVQTSSTPRAMCCHDGPNTEELRLHKGLATQLLAALPRRPSLQQPCSPLGLGLQLRDQHR
jgi:hypothetical protein